MKKSISAVVLGLLLAISAQATTYVDVNADMFAFNSLKTTYSNEFNLLDVGYKPASETISDAYAVFAFTDLFGGRESYTVNLGGDTFSSGSFSVFMFLPTNLSASALFTLDQTGIISYTVTRTSGDFQLAGSALVAEATTRNVPDSGATVLLLGLGLSGILIAWRFGAARQRTN